MSWKECDRVSERREFVRLACVAGASVSSLCRRFGIARKTGYKWLKRYREEGLDGLADRSRVPRTFRSPTSEAVERSVLQIRDEHPAWGGRKIRARLLHLGQNEVPAASTITAILRRHGRLAQAACEAAEPFTRFEHDTPNSLWQVDFKGEFRMSDRRNCYPLTVLDDHSRYSLGIVACEGTTVVEAQSAMTSIFRRYGVPQAIYADNGPPFGAMHSPGRHTRLTVWFMRQGIRVIHGTPYHPQGRGKDERFHRTLKRELLQDRHFDDLAHTQRQFDPWRHMYNHERPHEALGLDVPASRYRSSVREFREHRGAFEYSDRFDVRRTNYAGRFKFKGRSWNAGGAFAHDAIGLTPAEPDGTWLVHYGHFPIGHLDLTSDHDRLTPVPPPTTLPSNAPTE